MGKYVSSLQRKIWEFENARVKKGVCALASHVKEKSWLSPPGARVPKLWIKRISSRLFLSCSSRPALITATCMSSSWWSIPAKWAGTGRATFFLMTSKRCSRKRSPSLRDDGSTKVTFDKPPLKAFRRAKNLKDILVHSSLPQVLQRQIGTFPRNRRDCRTCPFINSSERITTTQGQIKISRFFTSITSQLIFCLSRRKCPGVVYIRETGRILSDRFREHRLDVIKKKVALPVPAHFAGIDHQLDMQVAVIRAGLPEQDKRRREEMRFIHNFGTLASGGLNQDLSFTWLSRDFQVTCFYTPIFKFPL